MPNFTLRGGNTRPEVPASTTAGAMVLSENPGRVDLVIYNPGAVAIVIAFGTAIGTGITIAATSYLPQMQHVPTDQIFARSTGAAGTLQILEVLRVPG